MEPTPKQSFLSSLFGKVKNKLSDLNTHTYEVQVPQARRVRIATSSPQTASAIQGVAPLNEYKFDREDFRKRISHNETRGQKDPYRTVGVTKDLGRYQVSPDTLDAWSEQWLGKKYDRDSYLNDPDAQDRFFEEYMNVAEAYKLKPEEAAIAWHKGWGPLGQGSKQEREKNFRTHVNKLMADPNSMAYLNTFRNYGTE